MEQISKIWQTAFNKKHTGYNLLLAWIYCQGANLKANLIVMVLSTN
jgi:hypothetical protein